MNLSCSILHRSVILIASFVSLITSSILLSISEASAQSSTNSVAPLLNLQGVLEIGDLVFESDGSLYDVYTFEGRTGQQITIVLESLEFDTYLILEDEGGRRIGENDDVSETNFNSRLTIELPADGIYRVLANAYDNQGRGHYTLAVLEGQGSLSETASQQEAEQLHSNARQLLVQGQTAVALESFEEALAIYRQIHYIPGERAVLSEIWLPYATTGQYSEAISALNQQIEISKAIDDMSLEADALVNLGWVYYFIIGDKSQAFACYNQALKIYGSIDNQAGEASVLSQLGWAYYGLGNHQQSLTLYNQSIDIARQLSDQSSEAYALLYISQVYTAINQKQEAINSLNDSRRLFQILGNRSEEARVLRHLGGTYAAFGEEQLSIDAYQQSIAVYQDLDDRLEEGYVTRELGLFYLSTNRYADALVFLTDSLSLRRSIGEKGEEARVLSEIAFILRAQNQPELAILFYKQSVNVTENIREDLQVLPLEQQQAYTETIADRYRRLAELLLEQGRILEAQQVLELLKVEELREFTRGRVLNTATREIELTELEDSVWQEFDGLIALGQQIDACEQGGTTCDQLYDQRSQLTQAFNHAVASFTDEIRNRFSQDPIALNPEQFIGEANDILETPGTILIYPIVLEDKLWVLWATSGGVVNSIEVPVTRQQLGEAVLCFRQLMASPEAHSCETHGDTDIQAVAQELYRYLIPPQLEQEFAQHEIQNLVFSLDRVTRYIPIAALHDGEHYLIQRYTVSTILSAGLTRHDNPLPQSVDSTSVLALGLSEAVPENASEETPEFIALTHVPDELDAIGQIYPGEELLNQQFSDRAFHQLNDYQVLHIATHGVFIPARQDRSYLILGTKQPLRIRQIEDIQQFFSNLSLVVLSACETALGSTDQDGIEINGIAHSFIQSGANTVIASLWQVNDGSTSLLMQHFYNNLAQGTPEHPVTVSQALRQAQLSLLQGETGSAGGERGIVGIRVNPNATPQQADNGQSDYSHPYYWAPFILIGNGL